MSLFKSKFTSEVGDEWIFEYNPSSSISFVKGSDVDYQSFPVVEGYSLGLPLEDDEKLWLRKSWQEASRGNKAKALYKGLETKFVRGSNHCYLTENYCPICLKQRIHFDKHHCIWASEGGTDSFTNLLKICRTCHAVITGGCVDEMAPKNLAAFHHQIIYFGFNFIPRHPVKKAKYQGRSFLEKKPGISEILYLLNSAPKKKQTYYNQNFKTISRLAYQYFRDMREGFWTWNDHVEQEIMVVPWDLIIGNSIESNVVKN